MNIKKPIGKQVKLYNTLFLKHHDLKQEWKDVFIDNRLVAEWYERLKSVGSRLEKQLDLDVVPEDDLERNRIELEELKEDGTLDTWLTDHARYLVDTYGPGSSYEDTDMLDNLEALLTNHPEHLYEYQEYLAEKKLEALKTA